MLNGSVACSLKDVSSQKRQRIIAWQRIEKECFFQMDIMGAAKSNDTPWMNVALGERGIRRFGIGQTNPRIAEYNDYTNLRGYDDKISWCSSFVNWCLFQAGIAGTGSALARSWLEWGNPLESPVPGCVVVLTRDDPSSWKGHVGFFLRIEGDVIILFGGNQLDEVREHSYPVTTVLGYRWPACGS